MSVSTATIWTNLNALYVRPLDFDYLRSLKPAAARLYELLGGQILRAPEAYPVQVF